MIINQPGAAFYFDGAKFVIGEAIVGTAESEYEGLIGSIYEIRDGEDKETENKPPDLYCSFEPPVHPSNIKKLEEVFSDLYDQPKTLDDIILDMVIMAPSMVDPVRRIEELQTKLPVYVVSEDWAMDCDSGHSVSQFTDYADARRAFNEKLAEEMDSGCIPKWSEKGEYRTDYGQDFYDCWIDGEYAMNHYKLTICKDTVVLGPSAAGEVGRIHSRQCQYEDFISQVEDWDELSKLTAEEYLQFISDPRIPDMIDNKLGKNDPYWESYWESVSEAAHNLLSEYLKKYEQRGADKDEL